MLVIETHQVVSANKAGSQHSASMYVQCVVNIIVGDGSWTRQEEQGEKRDEVGLEDQSKFRKIFGTDAGSAGWRVHSTHLESGTLPC